MGGEKIGGHTFDDVWIAAKLTNRILSTMDSSVAFLGIACSRTHCNISFSKSLSE